MVSVVSLGQVRASYVHLWSRVEISSPQSLTHEAWALAENAQQWLLRVNDCALCCDSEQIWTLHEAQKR